MSKYEYGTLTHSLFLRLNHAQYMFISQLCETTGKNSSEVVRMLLNKCMEGTIYENSKTNIND